jgi:hypothetical protein
MAREFEVSRSGTRSAQQRTASTRGLLQKWLRQMPTGEPIRPVGSPRQRRRGTMPPVPRSSCEDRTGDQCESRGGKAIGTRSEMPRSEAAEGPCRTGPPAGNS